MNRRFFLILAVLCSFVNGIALFAQDTYKTDYEIEYDVKAREDKKLNSTKRTQFKLIIGDNASYFFPYKLEVRKQITDSIQNAGGGYEEINNVLKKKNLLFIDPIYYIYKFYGESPKLVWQQAAFDKHQASEDIPNISWNIVKGDSIICGQKCKKATSTFRGVNWEIWFAPEIPIDNGPWKLGGAPGLILSAQDSNGYFMFDCIAIRPKPSQFSFTKDPNTQELSPKELAAVLKKWRTNQADILEAKSGFAMSPETRAKISKRKDPIEIEIF